MDDVIIRSALAKLRRSTELACGYPDAVLSRSESYELLELIEHLEDRIQAFETGELPA